MTGSHGALAATTSTRPRDRPRSPRELFTQGQGRGPRDRASAAASRPRRCRSAPSCRPARRPLRDAQGHLRLSRGHGRRRRQGHPEGRRLRADVAEEQARLLRLHRERGREAPRDAAERATTSSSRPPEACTSERPDRSGHRGVARHRARDRRPLRGRRARASCAPRGPSSTSPTPRSVDAYLAVARRRRSTSSSTTPGINPLASLDELERRRPRARRSRSTSSAPMRLARGLAPGMVERGYGRIVNISSIWGVVREAAAVRLHRRPRRDSSA